MTLKTPIINIMAKAAYKAGNILINPNLYTVWFKIILEQFSDYINKYEGYSK